MRTQEQDRRQFVNRGLTAAGGLLIVKPATAFGSQANSALEVGIVGCGGRGTWIGGFFQEFAGARIVALADPIATQFDAIKSKLHLDSPRTYGGRKGYEDLAASNLDAVVIESPPYFHPEHAEAAVAAGKNVFSAKPIAVDVPGSQRFLRAGEAAAKKVNFWVDYQTRAQAAFQEVARRVHAGDIGDPVLGHVYYHGGRNQFHKTEGLSPAMARVRNWLHDKVLSGDIIVEQNVHVIDVANWYLQGHPLRACGTAGRKARLDGDVSDHFIVTYWYPDDVKVDFSSVQFSKGYGDLCIRLYGSRGVVDSHYGGQLRITGENPWPGVDKDPTFRDGAIANIKKFAEAVRGGEKINNVAQAVETNLTAILGRTAAYKGGEVTWTDMLRDGEGWDAQIDF
ncbi:MAG: Gfo/Idh/MocA family oxidoreductase [Bryobacterales bacterium]|nr:Gfo/Idh/MocA family oxidoreductase [Bryobacterales bacterium]